MIAVSHGLNVISSLQVLPSEVICKEAECYEGRIKNGSRTQVLNINKRSRQRQSREYEEKIREASRPKEGDARKESKTIYMTQK